MKKMAIFSLVLSLASHVSASTNSLLCAMSHYGTPTETARRAALPYIEVQIEKMGDSALQLYLVDNYNGGTSVAKVLPTKNMSEKTINGLMLGTYSSVDEGDAILRVVDGRINLIFQKTRFDCEIPGDYQADYSSYVK